MNKKHRFTSIFALSAVATISFGVTAVILNKNNIGFHAIAKDNVYWNHYSRVEPTETVHGSKEFWANCSTHDFSLTAPEVGSDVREGVAFNTTTYFASLAKSDPRYLPALNEETIDIKGCFLELLEALSHNPYSYIPDTMRPENVDHYSSASLAYDFYEFINVSSIHYGGFGEQWHMVIDNIKESQTFYNITSYGSEILTASRTVITTFLDEYYGDTIEKTFNDDSNYVSKINFSGTALTYNIQFNTGVTAPLFGTITPQIDMEYVLSSHTKTVRIQLGENAALKFIVTPDSYSFGLEYGITEVSRKAYFAISKDEYDAVEGHIYEFVQLKGKDVVSSCADFYIDEDYTSVVGNKASGIAVLDGYINELYETTQGKLLGYEIRETKSLVTYNTLWFNLSNITGFNNIRAIEKASYKDNENPHNVYVNNEVGVFEPTYNKIFGEKTSRKYDLELRNQFFYDVVDGALVEYETSIPMMFIQAGDNYNDYSSDIYTTSGIPSSVTLSNAHLTKIQDDYSILIDDFIDHKNDINSEYITTYIGEAAII